MSAPDLSSLGQGASDVLSSFGLVIPAVLLLLLAWATYRTGSTHLLLSRVWLLIFGKLDVSDQAIEGFLAKRDAFMKFRLVTGLKPRTLEQAKALIVWCDEHKEDVGDVKACGHFFDVEKLQLCDQLPGRRAVVAAGALALLFAGCAYVAVALAVFYPPAFKVNASGNWYWVEGGKATRIDVTSTSESYVDNEICRTAEPTGEGEKELKALCQLIGDDGAYIRSSALTSQRVLLAIVASIFALLGARVLLTLRQAKASRDMRKRLTA